MATAWEAGSRNPDEYVVVNVRGADYEVRSALTVKANRLVVSFQRFQDMLVQAKAIEDKHAEDVKVAEEAGKKPPRLPKKHRSSVSIGVDMAEVVEEIVEYGFGKDAFKSFVDGTDGHDPISYAAISNLAANLMVLWYGSGDDAADGDGESDPKV